MRCAGCADGFFSDWLKDFSDYYKYTPPKGGPSPMGSVDVTTCFASVPPAVKTLPAGHPSANLFSINCACWADVGGQADQGVSPMHKDYCKGWKGVAANYFCR
jgi:hypothetical protein